MDLTLMRRKKLTIPQNLIRHEGVALCDVVDLRMVNEPIVMVWMKMKSPSVSMCGAKVKIQSVHIVSKTLVRGDERLMRRRRRRIEPRAGKRGRGHVRGAWSHVLRSTNRGRRTRRKGIPTVPRMTELDPSGTL